MADEEGEVRFEHQHPKPHPGDQPVDVFETMQESEAWVVRGLLVAAGLEAEVFTREATADVLPGVGGFMVQVPEEDAEEARRIIAENRLQLTASGEATAEDDSAA